MAASCGISIVRASREHSLTAVNKGFDEARMMVSKEVGMSMLGRIALDFFGHEASAAVHDEGTPVIALPAPERSGGMPMMEALSRRRSIREFSPRELPPPILSNLLWAAFGVNRAEGHERTAPTASDDQEIELYVAMAGGLYLYDALAHRLCRVAALDARK